jgi:arsenate reductase
MAEAFMNHYAGEHVIAKSAGLEPGIVHPLTIEAMNEFGIDISSSISKRIDMKTFTASKLIVKVCELDKEKCPIVPFGVQSVQWDILDPTDSSRLEDFRVTRDEIRYKVLDLLKDLNIPVQEEGD